MGEMQNEPSWFSFLLLLGSVTILKCSTTFILWLYATFLRPHKDLRHLYGPWALITGATDGIGEALASHLALYHGLNLVLVGRNHHKLQRVSSAIRSKSFQTKTKLVVFDFADEGEEGLRRVKEAVAGVEVGLVVSNAGTTSAQPLYFHEGEEDVWGEVVRVNLQAATMVARAVVPAMVRRRRGAVVFIGSGAATALPSFPFSAVYAATKAYIHSLSRSLSVEYKDMGIHVQCQIPLHVATKMVPMKKRSTFVPSPKEYAIAAMRQIGYEPQCIPYWPHAIQCWLLSLLPHSLINSWLLKAGIRKRNKMEESHKID